MSDQPRPSAILNDAGALPQGDGAAWPTLTGDAVGRHRHLEVLHAGQVLDDVVLRLARNRMRGSAIESLSYGTKARHGRKFRQAMVRNGPGGP
jgi:hypothetical protein